MGMMPMGLTVRQDEAVVTVLTSYFVQDFRLSDGLEAAAMWAKWWQQPRSTPCLTRAALPLSSAHAGASNLPR